ncbi:MAG TPA: hypothetical protein VIV40_29845 [Kofleriaceae bacterium]
MIKTWWFAAVMLVGCSGDPDVDATGTVTLEMTYGAGTCQKTGSEPFTLHLAKTDAGSYEIMPSSVGETIGGDVACDAEACQIEVFKQWTDADFTSFEVHASLTLDGNDNSVTGTGTFSSVGTSTSCEQQLTFAGVLQ